MRSGAARYDWVVRPDQHACMAARPAAVSDDVELVVARAAANAAGRPTLLLPLIGTWFTLVLGAQLVLEPAAARVLWPIVVLALAGCVVAIARLRRGTLSSRGGWWAVSVLVSTQIATFIAAYFITGHAAYQSAIIIELFAITILDTRIRFMQTTICLVAIGWAIGSSFEPAVDEGLRRVFTLIGAATVGLFGHHLIMRSTYATEWLRVLDERRTDVLSEALTATAKQLRHRVRAERKLERALGDLTATQAQLLQAQKLEAIGQLAAGVAHEINTPTQYVSDNTTFLQESFEELFAMMAAHRERASESEANQLDYLADEVPRAIGQSLEGLRRISALIAALKDFSHPTAGEKATFDLNAAIQTTIAVARNEWKYVADLATDLDPALPPIWGVRDELDQVVLNMIVNAAHAIGERGGERGAISVRTSVVEGHAVIEIADDGAGIPDLVRHRIFEPFFTTKPMGKGTGKGLAISRTVIVDKHQGTIDVASEAGRGTTFTIRIPIGPGAATSTRPGYRAAS